MADGFTANCPAATHVPNKLTCCDSLLPVMVSVPVSVPTAVGAKLTLTVQSAPLSNVAGQLFDSEKAPVTEILLSDSVEAPTFVKVRFLLLDVFTTWLGKLNEDVDTAMELIEEEELL